MQLIFFHVGEGLAKREGAVLGLLACSHQPVLIVGNRDHPAAAPDRHAAVLHDLFVKEREPFKAARPPDTA